MQDPADYGLVQMVRLSIKTGGAGQVRGLAVCVDAAMEVHQLQPTYCYQQSCNAHGVSRLACSADALLCDCRCVSDPRCPHLHAMLCVMLCADHVWGRTADNKGDNNDRRLFHHTCCKLL